MKTINGLALGSIIGCWISGFLWMLTADSPTESLVGAVLTVGAAVWGVVFVGSHDRRCADSSSAGDE